MWSKGESSAQSATRLATVPRTTPSERDLTLMSELTMLLQGDDCSDGELLDEAANLLADAGATYVFDIVVPTRLRCREGGRSARHENAIDLQTLRVMMLGRTVFCRREEADALGLDWMVSVPIEGDDGPIGALTTYAPVDEGSFPSMPLVNGVAQLVGATLMSRRKRAAMRAAIDRRDVAMGTLAHDLKSPLTVILASARLLKSGAKVADPKTTAEAIERQATYMLFLVNDILELGVMSSPSFVLNRTDCVAGHLVGDAVAAVEPLAVAKEIALTVDVAQPLPTASADARRITQVLVNVLGNAVKFTPRGGAVTVGCKRRGRFLAFFVSDTGSGITPEERNHVFDRFWRGHPDAPGSGLGLSIAREIVEAHGGTIAVAESEPNQGTLVEFTLPTHVASARPGA